MIVELAVLPSTGEPDGLGPELEDHFLDEPERLREFELEALRAAHGPGLADDPLEASTPDETPAEDDAGPT